MSDSEHFSQHWNTDDVNLTSFSSVWLCHDEVQVLFLNASCHELDGISRREITNLHAVLCLFDSNCTGTVKKAGHRFCEPAPVARCGITQPMTNILHHPWWALSHLFPCTLNPKKFLRHVECWTIRLRYGFLDFNFFSGWVVTSCISCNVVYSTLFPNIFLRIPCNVLRVSWKLTFPE